MSRCQAFSIFFLITMVAGLLACESQPERRRAVPSEPQATTAVKSKVDQLMHQAAQADARGSTVEALGLYGEAATLDPERANAQVGLGDMQRKLNNTERAITAYRRAINVDRRAVLAYAGLGEIYRDQGRTRDAITQYLRAVAFEPDSIRWNRTLAQLYLDLNSPSEAVIFARRARDLNPDDPSLTLLVARAAAQASDHRTALRLFQEAEARAVLDLEDVLRMADAMVALNMPQEAIDRLRGTAYREHAGIQLRLGQLMLQQRMPQEAATAFDQAIALDPTLVPARNGKASASMTLYVLSDRQDEAPLREAIKQWQASLDLDPNQPRIEKRLQEAQALRP